MSTAQAVRAKRQAAHELDFDSSPTLSIRSARRQIKQLASIVAPGGRIHERMSGDPVWKADFNKRIIYWSPASAIPGRRWITHDELVYLTIHEAGHLEYSGNWTVPDLIQGGLFNRTYHRWVNLIEDIRMERLVGEQFGRFREVAVDHTFYALDKLQRPHFAQQPKIVQAELAFLALDVGYDLNNFKMDPNLRKWVEHRWPDLSQIIDDAPSTDDVQRRAFPIYLELLSQVPENERRGDIEGQGEDGWGKGGVVLVDPDSDLGKAIRAALEEGRTDQRLPFRSGSAEDDEDNTPGSADNVYGGDKAIRKVYVMLDEREEEQKENDAQEMEGTYTADGGSEPDDDNPSSQRVAGRGRSNRVNEGGESWDKIAQSRRREINSLAHQLRTVLRSNAQERMREGQRRGQINVRRAYRASAGNPNIFRQPMDIGGYRYVVGICPDISSSMSTIERNSGIKLLEPVVVLAEACERAGIEWFVLAWDTELGQIKHVRGQLDGATKQRLASGIYPRGGTFEPCMLLEAENQFRHASAGSIPILLTITDGATDGIEESVAMIDDMVESMGLHDISIFVNPGAGGGPDHHKTNLRASDLRELGTVLPRTLKSIIRRRHAH